MEQGEEMPQMDDGDIAQPLRVLNEEQIQAFLKDGVLVVDNILNPEQIQKALQGLSETLARNANVDTTNLSTTGHAIQMLSSTNGSGGVLDLFYEDWKCEIATNPILFGATTQLWEATYCHCGETREDLLQKDEVFRWHPFGPFDCHKGFCYIDRIGYRLPTELATQLGAELYANDTTTKKKKKKSLAIQRSLTPHLDCCPDRFFASDKSKWRPIQCFVSLSDTLEPNQGGFECVPGFHRNFHSWAETRPPTKQVIKHKQQIRGKRVVTEEEISFPAPCLGEYTHIRPVEDCDVMERVRHIPVKAGSAVFFDNRIPHANAYRHDGDSPRSVVYCSFLPDVPINVPYVSHQLSKWKRGEPPNDQWIGDGTAPTIETTTNTEDGDVQQEGHHDALNRTWLTPLARKLMGVDPW